MSIAAPGYACFPITSLPIFVLNIRMKTIVQRGSIICLILALLTIPNKFQGQDIYLEDFNLPTGTTVDNGATAWSIDMSNANPGTLGFFETRSLAGELLFMGHNVVGEAVWISQVIDISSVASVAASMDMGEFGTLEGSDYIRAYYILDNGSETLFASFNNDFGAALQTVTSPTLSGTNLQIVVRISNNSIFEAHFFDNVRVYDSSTSGTTLYSRRSRNWTNRNAWSTVGLGGASCSCQPDATTNVVIGNNHQIRLNRNGSVRDLTVQNNGRLYATSGQNILTVAGDVVQSSSNSDPIDLLEQTLTFSGIGDQSIGLNGESLDQIVVNKSGGQVILTQPLNLIGEISIQSATNLVSNGYLTLLSTSDGTSGNASIGAIANGGSVSGNVTVQRYISGEGEIWRYISSPVTNATVADWQDDFPITGTFADPSTGPGIDSSKPSLYEYGESGSGTNLSLGWQAYPSSGTAASNSLTPGTGYTALMLEGSSATLVDVTGPINQGNFNFNVSFAASGWNLLGNPYPATVDWGQTSGWSSSNLADAIYVRNNENGNENSIVASYVDGVGTNGGTGLIATGQAFWVQAIGPGPTLQINELAKSTSTGTFFRRPGQENLFRITLSIDDQVDEAVIRFSPEASFAYDPKKDAKKFSNGGINISSFVDDQGTMAINSLPELHCPQLVNLELDNTKPGNYQLTFTELAKLKLPYAITLIDHQQEKELTITDSTTYAFTVETDANAFEDRFDLLITPLQELVVPSFEMQALCDGGAEIFWENSLHHVMYTLYANDSLIYSIPGNGNSISAILPAEIIESKDVITIELESAICDAQLFQQELSLDRQLLPNIEKVIDGHSCTASEVVLIAEASSFMDASIQYNWYENESDQNPLAITATGEFVTPKLASSHDYYVSVSNSNGCESNRIKVSAEIDLHHPLQISQKDNLLSSNYPSGNQWYFNGEPLGNELMPSIFAEHPGTYGLEVTVGTCSFYQEMEIRPSDLISDSDMVVIFPNPASSVLYFEVKTTPTGSSRAAIIDMLGRTRAEEALKISNRSASLSINDLEPGVYYLKITTQNGIFTKKFLKRSL